MAKITDPRGIHFATQFYGSDLTWSIDEKTRQLGFTKKSHFSDNDGSNAKAYDIVAIEIMAKGCLRYVAGFKYPMRIASTLDQVRMVGQVKRLISELYSSAFSKKGNWVKKSIAIIFWRTHARQMLRWMQHCLRDVQYNKPECYQQPIRELWVKIGDLALRDVVCAILEHDIPYRYRFQDIFSDLSKNILAFNPLEEIDRLAKLLFERETGLTGMGKFRNMWPYLRFYLKHNKRLLGYIQKLLLELDIEEIRPSVEDRYWMTFYEDYKFFGMSAEELKKYRETL